MHARVGGEAAERAAELLAATGPGTWSAPVVLTLDEVALPASRPLPGRQAPAQVFLAADHHLGQPDPTAEEGRRISHTRLAYPDSDPHSDGADGVPGIPSAPSDSPSACCPPRTWAEVFADRSAGRVGGGRNGFALRPHQLPAACLADLLAWTTMTPTEPELAAVGRRITLRVAMQRVDGHASGLYRWQHEALRSEFTDPSLMRLLEHRGGQSSSPVTEIGLRHANLAWLLSADIDALLAEFGPAAWSLSQLYCGWVMHGLGTAAAAHGLVSRPTRSYDEPTMQQTLRLPRKEVPMFMTICGRSAFEEPTLDSTRVSTGQLAATPGTGELNTSRTWHSWHLHTGSFEPQALESDRDRRGRAGRHGTGRPPAGCPRRRGRGSSCATGSRARTSGSGSPTWTRPRQTALPRISTGGGTPNARRRPTKNAWRRRTISRPCPALPRPARVPARWTSPRCVRRASITRSTSRRSSGTAGTS